VLLQRIGRLHRHADRARPPGFESARCIVLVPEGGHLTPRLRHAAHGIGPERAYDNVLAVEAARRLVGTGAVWTIPDDNRRLVEAGTHPDALRTIAEELGGDWLFHHDESFAGRTQQRMHARDCSIDFAKPFSELRWPDGAQKLQTRLGGNDLSLPVEPALTSPFGGAIRRMRVPGWMVEPGTWNQIEGIDDPRLRVASPSALALGDQEFIYDRFGLRLADRGRATR
jgi:CRISPR-associated endonuclease/helicase Cas3